MCIIDLMKRDSEIKILIGCTEEEKSAILLIRGVILSVEIKIELRDYYTILNLHKALLEAKFHENPDNKDVFPSPIIADLCNKLVDALAKMDKEKSKENISKWDDWRMLKNQTFYRERAIKNAVMYSRWKRLTEDEKRKITTNMLSPFIATEEEIKCFIRKVNEILGLSC